MLFDDDLRPLCFNRIVTGLGVYVWALFVCVNFETPQQNWVDPCGILLAVFNGVFLEIDSITSRGSRSLLLISV